MHGHQNIKMCLSVTKLHLWI